MKRTSSFARALIATGLFTSIASAETYDFEIGIAYAGGEFDGSQTITTNGGTIFNSISTDTDDLSVVGSWYFTGLSDDKGPRARAVLVDRASVFSFRFSRAEQTTATVLTSDDPLSPFPPVDSTFESEGDTFGFDVRHAFRDSGWIGIVGLSTTSAEFSGAVSDSADATGWRLGVGKYLSENTTLGVDFSETNVDGGPDSTALGISLEHLGDLGAHWQYAVDVRYNRVDSDGPFEVDTARAAFSLYPTRDLELGVAVEDASGSGQDVLGLELFASWFVSPGFRVSAGYRVDDTDSFGGLSLGGAPSVSDTDQSSFRIGASLRF